MRTVLGMTTPQLCEWYVLCLNPAVGTSPHPIIGDVPICSRCAIKHELHIDYYPKGK